MTDARILKLRQRIIDRVAELNITPRHTEKGHFYYVPSMDEVMSSVTAEHRHIKDPSLREFEKNEALRFMQDWALSLRPEHVPVSETVIESVIADAKQAPILIRDTAGSKGNYIHDCREKYFAQWIKSGKVDKPEGTIEDIARGREYEIPQDYYSEVVSACAAMDAFVKEWNYIPIACEILVFDAKDKVAGTLDDIGVVTLKDGQRVLVLLDVKSSNQFKDTYTLQVMRYYKMFVRLFGTRPDRILIVKTGKMDRKYKLEWFSENQIIAGRNANKALIKFNNAWQAILDSRKKQPIIYQSNGPINIDQFRPGNSLRKTEDSNS